MAEVCLHPGTFNLLLHKIVQVQKGAQGRVRAGAALPFGQAASRREPSNHMSGNQACWDRSPGLNP